MEGKRTWRLGTWETTANAHYERAGAASKKPISHITRPALCTAGDISQSIAVAASTYLHRRGKPHMIPSWYGLCGSPYLPFDPSCSRASGKTPPWWDFNSASHSLSVYYEAAAMCAAKSKENNGCSSFDLIWFIYLFWLLLLLRYGRNVFSSINQCGIKALSIAFD